MWCRHFEINWSDDTRESPRLSDVPDSKVLTNTLLGTQMAKDPLPAPEDNVKPLNYKELFEGRQVASKFIDPCAAASEASMECMNRNDYDRDACLGYFQAYRDCKKAWIQQRKADRRAGRA